MIYLIFRYIVTDRFGSNRPMHQLEGINNKRTIIVGDKKLIRLYKEGRLKGHLPNRIKLLLGATPRKERSDKGIKKNETSFWLENKEEITGKKIFKLPDVFEVIPLDKDLKSK